MDRKRVRVMVASEYPELRRLLKGVVESKGGVAVVGEADNAGRALSLASQARPDIALIDCYLPQVAGNDRLPLSRMSGLDIAETIRASSPGVIVILVTDVDVAACPTGIGGSCAWELRTESTGRQVAPWDGQPDGEPMDRPVLARVTVVAGVTVREAEESRLPGRLMVYGGLAIVGGAALAGTLIFAPAGALMAGAGAVVVVGGGVGKAAIAFSRGSGREMVATGGGRK